MPGIKERTSGAVCCHVEGHSADGRFMCRILTYIILLQLLSSRACPPQCHIVCRADDCKGA